MSFMFGNGAARRAAEESRRQQEVANNRQLAELNRADADTGMTRRRALGRRLFADAGKDNLKGTIA